MIEVELRKLVKVDHDDHQLMLLEEVNSPNPRQLELVIGRVETDEMVRLLENRAPKRPLTHQLLSRVIVKLGGKLERVEIVKKSDQTYYAELHLSSKQGPQSVDCRPSDAVALALRLQVPIFASPDIFN